jgi:hypothetical protein
MAAMWYVKNIPRPFRRASMSLYMRVSKLRRPFQRQRFDLNQQAQLYLSLDMELAGKGV